MSDEYLQEAKGYTKELVNHQYLDLDQAIVSTALTHKFKSCPEKPLVLQAAMRKEIGLAVSRKDVDAMVRHFVARWADKSKLLTQQRY